MKNKILFSLALFMFSIQPAFAYLDPGTGSAIMSMIIGLLVAIGIFVKNSWYRIKNLLGLSKSKNTDQK
jgi:hypothetical protein|tara:strand:+ start:1214 stop:1420 length:207 start_codon:yes stop_codon:yes gene_type:complete